MNRIGPSPSDPYTANAGGSVSRMLTDSKWEDHMPLYYVREVRSSCGIEGKVEGTVCTRLTELRQIVTRAALAQA